MEGVGDDKGADGVIGVGTDGEERGEAREVGVIPGRDDSDGERGGVDESRWRGLAEADPDDVDDTRGTRRAPRDRAVGRCDNVASHPKDDRREGDDGEGKGDVEEAEEEMKRKERFSNVDRDEDCEGFSRGVGGAVAEGPRGALADGPTQGCGGRGARGGEGEPEPGVGPPALLVDKGGRGPKVGCEGCVDGEDERPPLGRGGRRHMVLAEVVACSSPNVDCVHRGDVSRRQVGDGAAAHGGGGGVRVDQVGEAAGLEPP